MRHLINSLVLHFTAKSVNYLEQQRIIEEFELKCKLLGIDNAKMAVLKRRAQKAAQSSLFSFENCLTKEIEKELKRLSIKL